MRMAVVKVTGYWLMTAIALYPEVNTHAQSDISSGNHTLMAGTGMQLITDDKLALAARRLNSMALTWSFSHRNADRKKTILVAVERGVEGPGKDLLRSNAFTLQYADGFSIVKNKAVRWKNYTGYSLTVNPQYLKSAAQFSWASANSFSFYNSVQYSGIRSSVSLDISVPLVGLGSRPEANKNYKGSVNDMLYNSFSHLAFTSLHNLKAVSLFLLYKGTVTDRLQLTAGLAYSYKNILIHQQFLQQAYGIQAGLSYRVR